MVDKSLFDGIWLLCFGVLQLVIGSRLRRARTHR
jgi:hypothetical protein